MNIVKDFNGLLDGIKLDLCYDYKHRVYYYNIPCAFDIETSSFIYNGNECACMYVWQFGFGNNIIFGRTWKEYEKLCDFLEQKLILQKNKRYLIVYVHNLSYEFQFIRKLFNWTSVFANDDEHKIIYAKSSQGIEYRCSYLLSGFNLDTLANNLTSHKIKKLIGNLDYKLLRHSDTILSQSEVDYCINDIEILIDYITELIESEGDIYKIPLTKTGYVRRYCRSVCLNKNNYKKYHEYMLQLTLNVKLYKLCQLAFMGGFTHANATYSGLIMNDVTSLDISSSYPTVMICEEFPADSGREYIPTDHDDFINKCKIYCCLIDITLYNIDELFCYEHAISLSKCIEIEYNNKPDYLDNGRVVSAKKIRIVCTNIDIDIYFKCYSIRDYNVNNMIIFNKSYLPKSFISCILKLYNDKTLLKGNKEYINEYQKSKGMLNATYGMTVTNPLRDEYLYNNVDGEFDVIQLNSDYMINKKLDEYNKSRNRFLYYVWGVFITAYARKNLWSAIFECEEDYIYSDTDSVKLINYNKHKQWFDEYNINITLKTEKCLKYYDMDVELLRPKNKQIGIFELECEPGTEISYKYFKTLGAKRYMTYKYSNIETDVKNLLSLTISGVNKYKALPYLLKKFNNNVLDIFRYFNFERFKIPGAYTGKNIHKYIDHEIEGTVYDYKGVKGSFHEMSSIYMCESDYEISNNDDYMDFIEYVNNISGGSFYD